MHMLIALLILLPIVGFVVFVLTSMATALGGQARLEKGDVISAIAITVVISLVAAFVFGGLWSLVAMALGGAA